MSDLQQDWARHLERLHACRVCPGVQGPPVVGAVPGAAVYLMGQAPGVREREVGRPFTWSAGKTLFRWFASLGVDEAQFRAAVYMGAAIRCFPGRVAGKQGDRKPSGRELAACAAHFAAEFDLLRPRLVLPVGRLAIECFLAFRLLEDVVGQAFTLQRQAHRFTCIPLPHPSGLSRWLQGQPGRGLLQQALGQIAVHPAWRETFSDGRPGVEARLPAGTVDGGL